MDKVAQAMAEFFNRSICEGGVKCFVCELIPVIDGSVATEV